MFCMEHTMTCQLVLDRIHVLALQFRTLMANPRSQTPMLRRLTVKACKDISSISERLFRSEGTEAHVLIADLNELDWLSFKLSKQLNISFTELRTFTPFDISSVPGEISDICGSIHEQERTWKFQHELWKDKVCISLALKTSLDQFTYGTSSFQAWLELCQQSLIQVALHRHNAQVSIFGSSSGLLAFYTAQIFPQCKCTGYEILPCLHSRASALAARYGNDMMTANIKEADVVVLTSLCWDRRTRERIALKLAQELRPGAVVIDYRDDTFTVVEGIDEDSNFYINSYEQPRSSKAYPDPSEEKRPPTMEGLHPLEVRGSPEMEDDYYQRVRRILSKRSVTTRLLVRIFGRAIDCYLSTDGSNLSRIDASSSAMHIDTPAAATDGSAPSVSDCYSATDASIGSTTSPCQETPKLHRFKLGAIVQGVVSWADAQKFFVYTCVD